VEINQQSHRQHSVSKEVAMELLDRYLQAVRKHLPWQRQDDIIAELRANLESQLEDKEAELGRPLTPAEAEQWLKQMGPPMQVAARYQPQQYLIGPTLFPTYWYVLRTAFGWALAIYLIVAGVQLMGEAPSATAVVEALLRVPGVLMTVAAWVTLVFAAIEFAGTRGMVKIPPSVGSQTGWNPCALPPVDAQPAGGKKRRSFSQAVGEVVFGLLGLIWLLLLPRHPFLLFGPGAFYLSSLPYRLAPVWMQFYWWVVSLNLIQLAWNSINLWRGTWRGPRLAYKTVTGVFGLIPLVVLLVAKDHAYVLVKNAAADRLHDGATLDSINRGIYFFALFIFIIATLQLFWEIWKMGADAYRKRASAMR
jgi:hypothetical protein